MKIVNPLKKYPLTSKFAMALSLAYMSSMAGIYWVRIHKTNSYNWNEQSEILNKQNVERKNKERKFDELYVLFLAYADTDRKGGISFEEQVEAWKKLGYNGPYFESEEKDHKSQFKTININDLDALEKAVNMYRTKSK